MITAAVREESHAFNNAGLRDGAIFQRVIRLQVSRRLNDLNAFSMQTTTGLTSRSRYRHPLGLLLLSGAAERDPEIIVFNSARSQ